MRPLVLLVALTAVSLSAQPRELRWAADPEGGAPYVEADPADPSRVEGFEVDIADLDRARPRAARRGSRSWHMPRSTSRSRAAMPISG